MAWHIQQNGQPKGPYTDEQLKALCETGTLHANSMIWKSGMAEWKPMAQTDFAHRSLASATPTAGMMMPVSGGYAQVYANAPQEDQLSIWRYFTRAMSSKYGDFHGRATRKEYWGTLLFWFLFLIAATLIGVAIDGAAGNLASSSPGGKPAPVITIIAVVLWVLFSFIPNLAILARRFHDIGMSGWLILVTMIPYVGWLFHLVCCLLPSQPDANKYGRPIRFIS